MKIFKVIKEKEFLEDIRSLFWKYGMSILIVNDTGTNDDFAIENVSKALGDNKIPLYISKEALPIQEQIGGFRLEVSGKVREYEDNKIKIEPSMNNLGESILTIKNN